ncbi:hypothetical protein BU25DRAFT_269448 [Macroventuria anomochaeta]|uniref:Uncharacterized protein n=1 Tax=Macroventuria anomochaeta TaxID=301207 RepID=A0ACB6S6B1_9PLEO|nr:uncharacterized protein BU25DRAFT_269448 [Macroventuria anomochaeta]KAF2629584.1 hypothetical protein BU25DRAFT_269448 [Macroventuria anomochaeta]
MGQKTPTFAVYNPILEAPQVGVIVVRGAGGAPADAGDPLWGSPAVPAATGASNSSTVVPRVPVWLKEEFGSFALRKRSMHTLGDSRRPTRRGKLHVTVQHLVSVRAAPVATPTQLREPGRSHSRSLTIIKIYKILHKRSASGRSGCSAVTTLTVFVGPRRSSGPHDHNRRVEH